MVTQLRRALPLVASVLLVGVLGVLAAWGQLSTVRQVDATQRADRLRVQQILGGLTEQYLQFVLLDTSRAADAVSWRLRPGDPADAAALARLVRTSHVTSYAASLTTLSGQRLSTYAPAGAPSPADPGFTAMRRALLSGRPGVSDVVRVRDDVVVAFAVPVRRAGVPAALLVAYADTKTWPLQAYDATIDLGPTARTHVVDGRGWVAASNDVRTVGTQLTGLPAEVGATDRGVRRYSRDGVEHVVSWAGVGNGWSTVTRQELDAFSGGHATSSRREALALVALLTVFVGLLAGLNHQRQQALGRLAEERLHDPLTGLPQRRLFELRLEAALARQRRRGTPLALLYCDLDSFKAVNDSYGHNCGDRLLVDVARRLVGALREDDFVARLGGDEFAVLLEGSDVDEVRRVIGRLEQAVREPVDLGGAELRAGVSIGAAVLRDPSRQDDLVAEADLAMYRVKRGGGDAVVVLDALVREPALSAQDGR